MSRSRKRVAYGRGSFASFPLAAAIVFAGLGVLAALSRPPAAWVERAFTNGYYPRWEQFWSSFTPAIPFAVGDAVVAAGVLALIGALVAGRPFWRGLCVAVAIAGLYVLWFYAGWGFGYDRAPLETRTQFAAARVTPATTAALRARAIAVLNRLAPLAHSRSSVTFDDGALRTAWTPVVRRLGDDWDPNVRAAKPALAGWFMNATGTSGFTNPFTLETQLAPDLLWFERPFSQAHEWSHVAGFNREDEANYIAVLACLRDPDPVVQYSGWLELFLYLPSLQRYPHRVFVPQVWADFAAIRARNARFVNLRLSQFSWHVYNSYLKTNHVAAGVQNYNEVTRLMVGIPLDPAGLPVAR